MRAYYFFGYSMKNVILFIFLFLLSGVANATGTLNFPATASCPVSAGQVYWLGSWSGTNKESLCSSYVSAGGYIVPNGTQRQGNTGVYLTAADEGCWRLNSSGSYGNIGSLYGKVTIKNASCPAGYTPPANCDVSTTNGVVSCSAPLAASGTCPTGSSGTYPNSCTCDGLTTPDETGQACAAAPPVTACTVYPSGSSFSVNGSGGAIPESLCLSNCIGSMRDGITLVDGSWGARYRSLGTFCSVNDNFVGGSQCPYNTSVAYNDPACGSTNTNPVCPAGEVYNSTTYTCWTTAAALAAAAAAAGAAASAAVLAAGGTQAQADAASAAAAAVINSGGTAAQAAIAGAIAAGAISSPGTSTTTTTNTSTGSESTTTSTNTISDFCTKNPTFFMCQVADYGTVDDVAVSGVSRSVAITPVSVGSAGSCPAPSPMTLHGQTYYFTWTTYCNFATGIKPILLAFAWLSAAGILIGGFRN